MNEGENETVEQIEPGAAGAPEGAVAEPTTDEIAELYKATGVKAPVPTGKSKGRPKATEVRAEDDKKKPAGNSDSGKKAGDDDDKSKSKDAPAPSKDGDSGDDSDAKGKKVGEDSAKVSDKSEKADGGVRDAESKGEGDAEPGSEGSSEQGTERSGQEAHPEGGEAEEEQDAEGKRPGKSNPAVEQRFQKLTSEVKERDQVIADLQKQLQEKEQSVEQSKIAQEDPEFSIDDFRKVRDSEGNILDLDAESAELAWRRWKDGYDQRGAEREAESNRQATMAEAREKHAQELMKTSVEAYDTLAGLMDEYPELVTTSGKFDPDFAADAMPIINDATIYLEGTEPGNAEGKLPVITGLRINPKKILDALKKSNNKKRTLPLNGVNDNVEPRSNVAVPHSRSSDSTVNAANELMKEFGINKRF